MRFKLKSGKYTELIGDKIKTHLPGAIIKSEENLCEKFRNCFERVENELETKAKSKVQAVPQPVEESPAIDIAPKGRKPGRPSKK